MIIDFNALSPNAAYYMMSQSLVPRPIAWVLSENANGSYNLAPFSWFNAISSDPPMVMISLGKKPDGSDKDTHANIRDRRHYTIHIAHEDMLTALNESSATLDANESEVEKLQLELADFDGRPLPRLAGCKLAYSCELADIHEIGNKPQAVIYGEIKTMFIDDDIASTSDKGRVIVHADRLKPIARLGASEYMAPGEVISLKRPA